MKDTFTKLPPGIWRGTLELDNVPSAVSIEDEVSMMVERGDILPFLFELKYDDKDQIYIEIINGRERQHISNVYYGRDKATAKDTIKIDFPVYDATINAIYEENILEGSYKVNYRNYSIPFKAYYGQDHLFTTNIKFENSHINLNGTWEVEFSDDDGSTYPAIGEFKQDGNSLTGTFLTETGDYRYLNGQIIGDQFYLATFDGAHAFHFTGKVMEDNALVGTFRSGRHYKSTWTGVRNKEAHLTNAFDLTKVIGDDIPLPFEFTSTTGETINLTSAKYQGKYKLIQIMGTWCPNCKDETKFLKEWLSKEKPQDFEVIAVGFEKYNDRQKAIDQLAIFKDRFDIPYDVVYGGSSDKKKAGLVFPTLNKIISYPTLLFLDKENKVRKIHTGFAGPATSKYHEFKVKFNEIIKQLRQES